MKQYITEEITTASFVMQTIQSPQSPARTHIRSKSFLQIKVANKTACMTKLPLIGYHSHEITNKLRNKQAAVFTVKATEKNK